MNSLIILLPIICLSVFFPKYSYSINNCEDVFSALISDSVNLIKEVKVNLKSPRYQDRLKALGIIRDINPDGSSIYVEIIPFIQDVNPQVRIAAARVFEQQEAVDTDVLYALYRQLGREDNLEVSEVLNKVIGAIHTRHWEQLLYMGEKVKEALYDLDFSIEKANSLVEKLNLTPSRWLKITSKALTSNPEDRTPYEQLAFEIYNEISSAENNFEKMIKKLPFKSSLEFFQFIVHYQKSTGNKLKMSLQTYFIIRKIYSLVY